MKYLLLNQTFHPDLVATAQYLSDLAHALVQRGHTVSVIAGRHAYEDSGVEFPARESWNGINIRRVRGTRFGKKSKWRRAADFGSFGVACCWRLLWTRRPDVVVALTSPPLISFIAACFALVRRCRFAYWVMDLNPDEAIAAGWLREKSLLARFLEALSRFSLRRADRIIVLDRFMRDRVMAKGIPANRVVVIPPWSFDGAVSFNSAGRERFRRAHGLSDKFTVMYSGNHSPCHPLSTLLQAAQQLAADPRFTFCFIGGGSEFVQVKRFAAERSLANIHCLPYQPLDGLAASLSAADLHVVIMGEKFVGTIHPCKIYNVMRVAPAILYVGPPSSHVMDIFGETHSPFFRAVPHGDSGLIVEVLRDVHSLEREPAAFFALADACSRERLLPRLLALLESLGGSTL